MTVESIIWPTRLLGGMGDQALRAFDHRLLDRSRREVESLAGLLRRVGALLAEVRDDAANPGVEARHRPHEEIRNLAVRDLASLVAEPVSEDLGDLVQPQEGPGR